MLKILNIKNLVLIESCMIEFHEGLNILSGETGAGKTALIEGVALVLGERADSSCIRSGMEKANVEAAFEISELTSLHELLQQEGIEHDKAEYLILRREISRQGRSRAFIGNHMVPLTLLQKIGTFLVDMIGQHSHQELRTESAQRSLLDLFAGTKEELAAFGLAWTKEKELQEKLNALLSEVGKRERLLEACAREKEELEDAGLTHGEEELLFEEYNLLSHSQELSQKSHQIYEGILEMPSKLMRYKQLCEQLAAIDPSLKESAELISEAAINLQETAHTLNAYQSRLESNPMRLAFLEERLKLIDRLKRKFGDPFTYLAELQSKCEHLENLDEALEEVKQSLKEAAEATTAAALVLTQRRKDAAKAWEEDLTRSLVELNMQSAVLRIRVEKAPRALSGEDLVQFWLSANKGEEPAAVKDNASGGELSRLLFAIKTTLAERNNTPTLIFDEIDANVGGKTSSIIGGKLRALGKFRQVLCITHFPQVAAQADHHFSVFKEEIEGRTLARIAALEGAAKEKEIQRMLGG